MDSINMIFDSEAAHEIGIMESVVILWWNPVTYGLTNTNQQDSNV